MYHDNGRPRLRPSVARGAFDALQALAAALRISPPHRRDALYGERALAAAPLLAYEREAQLTRRS